MMCKMVKKGLVGAGLGVLTLGLLFGTSAPSYVKTAFHKVRGAAQESVPIEYKIDQARQQVAALEPAIRKNIEALVRAEVDAEDLERQIELTQTNLNRQAEEMLALKDQLNGRLELTTSGGVTYTADEIKTDLARRLDTYRRGKDVLETKQQTLKEQRERVAAITKALNEMAGQKKAIEAQIESIETRLAQIRATEAANEYSFDTTPLSRVKETVAELDKQLEVMSRKAEYEGRYVEQGITVPVEPTRDVVREIEEELGERTVSTEKSL